PDAAVVGRRAKGTVRSLVVGPRGLQRPPEPATTATGDGPDLTPLGGLLQSLALPRPRRSAANTLVPILGAAGALRKRKTFHGPCGAGASRDPSGPGTGRQLGLTGRRLRPKLGGSRCRPLSPHHRSDPG